MYNSLVGEERAEILLREMKGEAKRVERVKERC